MDINVLIMTSNRYANTVIPKLLNYVASSKMYEFYFIRKQDANQVPFFLVIN